MSKNLKYFMREAAEVERVVTVPAPESFKDENGKVIQLEVKVLSSERIRAINEAYHTHTVALDKKGNPYINGGNVVFRDERDNAKATRHILVESLQYPKLDDPELMKYYNCVDITQMPEKVFSRADEFAHVTRVVMALLGILYSGREDSAESTVRTGAAYAQTTLVAIAPAFQQERAAAAYTARTGCGVIENTHYIVQTAQKGSI